MVAAEMTDRHAELLLEVGLRFESGDRLIIWAEGDVLPLAHSVAEQARLCGATHVDLVHTDLRLAAQRASADATGSLEGSVDQMDRLVSTVAGGASLLRIMTPPPELDDPKHAQLMSQHLGRVAEGFAPVRAALADGSICWCVTAAPTVEWASRVYPDRDEASGVTLLSEALGRALKLDRANPVAEWEQHLTELRRRAHQLTERNYDALRYRGPGTDLTVGLAVGHRWVGGGAGERRGCCPNLPTEEVFTAPHRDRVDGTVAMSKPAVLAGTLVDGIRLTFADGRVTAASADRGSEALRQFLDIDDGASRCGEVALVPQSSGVASEQLVWLHALLDENDASHIALGTAIPVSLPPGASAKAAGLNSSRVHHDFVVGSDQLDVYGVRADGGHDALLMGGEWADDQ